MQINSISMVSANRNIGFKAAEKNQPKPLVEVTPDMPDDQVVQYSTWGGNYAFPVTAGDLRKMQAEKVLSEAPKSACACGGKEETPEEYYARKINSVEWML